MDHSPRTVTLAQILLLAVCVVATLAPSAIGAEQTTPALDPTTITIPPESGYLGEMTPASTADAPVIVHIREVHAEPQTQWHIVEILDHLVRRYQVRLILLEGGTGEAGLRHLRRYASAAKRKRIAEKYLQAGILSATGYVDLVSDHPLVVWGVEDRALYNQNWQTLQEHDQARGAFTPFLAQIRQAAQQLQPRLLSPAMVEFDEARGAYDRGTLSLGEYVQRLVRTAGEQHTDLSAYDELSRFVALTDQEQQIDRRAVQQEQAALVQRVQQTAGAGAMKPLAEAAAAVKAKTAPPESFYHVLIELAGSQQIPLTDYPQLSAYLAHLTASKSLRIERLAGQVDALAVLLRTELAKSSPETQRLLALLDEVTLIEHLVALELSPDEYQRLKQRPRNGLLCGWSKFVTAHLDAAELPVDELSSCHELDAQLPHLLAFYDSAEQRDQALAVHSLAKLRESGERVAVLITGGFHGEGLTQQLSAQGVTVVAVTPKVGSASNPALYKAVLKYKRGLMSLDQMMAVGEVSAASRGARR